MRLVKGANCERRRAEDILVEAQATQQLRVVACGTRWGRAEPRCLPLISS